jgi:tryptophan synthase alpha chain
MSNGIQSDSAKPDPNSAAGANFHKNEIQRAKPFDKNKLKNVFRKKNVFIPYLTFGDPTIETSLAMMQAAVDAGADILEIGIPFSDPIADGPVIQASHQRALAQPVKPTLEKLFSVLPKTTFLGKVPVILMLSANLVLHHGIDRFFADAAMAGVSAAVIPDLSIEEAAPYILAAKAHGVPIVFLVSTLCTDARLKKILRHAEGFVYLISSTGLTGTRDSLDMTEISAMVSRIKAIKKIPVAVGFGVKTRSQADALWQVADGVIVGSYLVGAVEDSQSPVIDIINLIARLCETFTSLGGC